MQWTRERTSWLGTRRERRGRWHGVPYVLSTTSRQGMTRTGWVLVALALVVLAVVVLAEEVI